MKNFTFVFAALLATRATAAPSFHEERSEKTWQELTKDVNFMCAGVNGDSRWDSLEKGLDHWVSMGGSEVIKNIDHDPNQGKEDWVKNLESRVYGNDRGKTRSADCAILGGTCEPGIGLTCKEHHALMTQKGGVQEAGNKVAWWIFEAVKGMHTFFKEFHRQLQDATTALDLRLDQMVEDLGESKDKYQDSGNTLLFFTTALDLASEVAEKTMAPYAMVKDMMMESMEDESEPINGKLRDSLADTFTLTVNAMERALRAAVGSAREDHDYDYLPWTDAYNEDPKSRLASFFNTGGFISEIDKNGMTQVIEDTMDNLQRKMVINILNAQGYYLMINDQKEDWAACHVHYDERIPYGLRMFKHEGKDWCVQLMRRPSRKDEHTGADDALYHNLEKYGIDIEGTYKKIMDCAFHMPDGESRILREGGWHIADAQTCFLDLRVIHNYGDAYNPFRPDMIYNKVDSFREINKRPGDEDNII